METKRETPETDAIRKRVIAGNFDLDDLLHALERFEKERDEALEALSGRTVSCERCNEAASAIAELNQRLIERQESFQAQLIRIEDTWREKLKEQAEQIAALRSALDRIHSCADSPDIDVSGEYQTGLHCGVEDRDCQDRYQGADYGWSQGVERTLEWAQNEAAFALKQHEALTTKHQ